MHSILVRDYMDVNPHAIFVESSVEQAVLILLREKISGAPVIDHQKRLVGFVSEQDCIKEQLNDSFYANDSPSVAWVMQKDVKTVSLNTSILEVAETMAKRPPKNYPVVEGGKLVGLISRRLILSALLESNRAGYAHA